MNSPLVVTDQTTGWAAHIGSARLAPWMAAQGFGTAPITDISRLTGGTQNILFAFTQGARRFVLRRPPAIPLATHNETMRREARVLAALATSEVPHPRLIAACADESVLGVAFYLMEAVDGFNATVALPEPHRSSPALRRALVRIG